MNTRNPDHLLVTPAPGVSTITRHPERPMSERQSDDSWVGPIMAAILVGAAVLLFNLWLSARERREQ